jgi:chromate transporter
MSHLKCQRPSLLPKPSGSGSNVGFISFGGPAGQISILHQELVEQRRWISEKRFLHALNYCMVLPGPEAQQLVTYIGWLMHKRWGGIVAGALFVLPSLILLIALSWVYIAYGDIPVIAGSFYGIKPAVTAIVVQAAHRIGSRALQNKVMWGIAGASFVAIFALDAPFPLIVGIAALVGFVGGKLSPETFRVGGGHGSKKASYGPALIDDHTPTAAHAKFHMKGLMQVLVVGAMLWAIPIALLNTLIRMGTHLYPNGLVLHQSRMAHVWGCLRRTALCLPRRDHRLCMGNAHPNDGWSRPG